MKRTQKPLPLAGGRNPEQPEHVRVMRAVSEHLAYLHARWGDESEYEDPEDYARAAAQHLKDAGATFVAMDLSPFRVVFRLRGDRDAYTIHVTPSRGGRTVKVVGPFRRIAPENYLVQARADRASDPKWVP